MTKRMCFSFLLPGLLLIGDTALALSKQEVRQIIEASYPGARITEIEKEIYRGQRIIEVDFRHQGQRLEAIIGLDGEMIKVGIDD